MTNIFVNTCVYVVEDVEPRRITVCEGITDDTFNFLYELKKSKVKLNVIYISM